MKKKNILIIIIVLVLIGISFITKDRLFTKKSDNRQIKETTVEEEINDKETEEIEVEDDKDRLTTSKGFKIEVIDGVTYIDGTLIANKT